jgi:hypothetical protein
VVVVDRCWCWSWWSRCSDSGEVVKAAVVVVAHNGVIGLSPQCMSKDQNADARHTWPRLHVGSLDFDRWVGDKGLRNQRIYAVWRCNTSGVVRTCCTIDDWPAVLGGNGQDVVHAHSHSQSATRVLDQCN